MEYSQLNRYQFEGLITKVWSIGWVGDDSADLSLTRRASRRYRDASCPGLQIFSDSGQTQPRIGWIGRVPIRLRMTRSIRGRVSPKSEKHEKEKKEDRVGGRVIPKSEKHEKEKRTGPTAVGPPPPGQIQMPLYLSLPASLRSLSISLTFPSISFCLFPSLRSLYLPLPSLTWSLSLSLIRRHCVQPAADWSIS